MAEHYYDYSFAEVCPLPVKSGMERGKEDYLESAEGKV